MTSTENPIDNDDRLKKLLSQIRKVKSEKAYNTWRKEFLRIYTKYLDSNGILNGKDANYRLLKQLAYLQNRIQLVVPVLEQGTLRTTNGRRLLKNLTDEVMATERKVQELLPKTNADEERFGFDKFELAAVLLEDGFHGYDAMNESRQILEAILQHIVGDSQNTNEVAILIQYSDSVESFVRVMEDLKLVKIMNHCVDVVYKGTKRPEPKPPPPPSDDDDELPEDSSIDSDLDVDSRRVESKGRAPSQRFASDPDASPRESAEAKAKKKKPKPSGKALSSSKSSPTKKKKKSKKKVDTDVSPAFDDKDEDSEAIQNKPRNSKSKPKSNKKKPKGKPSKSSRREEDEDDNDSDKNDDSDNSSEEEEDEDDKDQGNGEPPEFLLYYDPKTNSIGRINREQAVSKSTLIVDKSKEAEAEAAYADSYKNVIESKAEKQELIFMLKKLERQKPEEESWLDKIKKEKQASKGNNTQQKKFKSTAGISRRSSIGNDSVVTFDSSVRSSASKRNSISGKPLVSPVATKPKPSGWSKPTSSRGLRSADKPETSGWSKPTLKQ